jgi:hypothetical protein
MLSKFLKYTCFFFKKKIIKISKIQAWIFLQIPLNFDLLDFFFPQKMISILEILTGFNIKF